jgi:predicted metal-binding membrane protein
MPRRDHPLIVLLKQEGLVVAVTLAAIAILAWAYILFLANEMPASGISTGMNGADMGTMMAPAFARWTTGHMLFIFVMWVVMMTGMMIPSATPMILIYTQVARQASTLGTSFAPAGWFASGYLLAWTAFAALATLAQYALERAALLSPVMMTTSHVFGGAVLVAAGVYQLTSLKGICLSHCRAPLSFVQRHGGFRPDALGSLRLGLLHGSYCIGCCWALMALLFVGGVMNVLWIAGITVLVIVEKGVPGGRQIARLAGMAAVLFGGWMIVARPA